MGISSEQIYLNYGKADPKKLNVMAKQKEAAAITMAKKAVNEYV